jgi:hypothetical protein
VQPHGFSNLLQHELTVGFQVISRQALGAARNQDRIEVFHTDTFGELVEHQVKAMIEAPDDRSVAFIAGPGRFEMEYLANKAPRVGTLYRWNLDKTL